LLKEFNIHFIYMRFLVATGSNFCVDWSTKVMFSSWCLQGNGLAASLKAPIASKEAE
jgi:hypothetical protein